jgi:hypothetical protein
VERARATADERPGDAGEETVGRGRGGRMSRRRETAAVLQLVRGEDVEAVSRSLGVTAATASGWRAAGEAALTTKPAAA